ncbi:MAG: branched-chain amino acid ABC transporter substrate-binding protein [Aestuariivirga sp.]
MKALRAIFVICLAGLAVSGAADADILLGVAGPLSGQYANLGQQMLIGAQAAVDAINARGGVAGQSLQIMSLDDGCDNRQAEDVAQKFVDAKVSGVIGHYCSNAALAAAKIYERAGVIVLAPVASQPALTNSGLSNVIRIASRDDMQGAFAAARIIQKRANARIALLIDGTSANKAQAASFVAALGKPPALTLEFKPDTQDFSDLITKMKTENIDVAYFACGASDAGHISAQAAKADLKLLRYGPDALVSDLFGQAAGATSEGMLASFPVDPLLPVQSRSVVAALKLAGQSADGAALPAYAAVQSFAAGAAATNGANGSAIATWLKSGQSIDTVEGTLSFDKNGDATPVHFSWYIWINGGYQALPEGN